MSSIPQILNSPEPRSHFVQLSNGDTGVLAIHVAHYLWEGLRSSENAVVIATAEHLAAFIEELEKLGANVQRAIIESRLLLLDAERTLGEFMLDGEPDLPRFENVILGAIARVKPTADTPVRAYGEMVGVLWTQGRYGAAIRLEELWNGIIADGGLTLFCSYPIDIFSHEFYTASVRAILCDHTHVVPSHSGKALEEAIERAMRERLGTTGELAMHARDRRGGAALPKAERLILWLRKNMPTEAEDILRLARQYTAAA
jgi:hypothetical protein